MEALTELAMALAAATMLVSLYMIMRLMMRSDAAPAVFRTTLAAYAFSVPFTIAVAGSFAYVTYAVLPFAGMGLAIIASLAVHSALLVIFLKLMPVKAIETKTARQGDRVQQSGAIAA